MSVIHIHLNDNTLNGCWIPIIHNIVWKHTHFLHIHSWIQKLKHMNLSCTCINTIKALL